MSFKLVLGLILPLLSPILPFSIVLDSDGTCSATNLLCLSENSFVYCSTASDILVVSKTEWFCPTGYVCDSSGTTPCVDPSLTATTTTTTTTTTTPEPTTTSTAASTTTTTGSTTTVAPPACYSHTYSKGPTCSQYYECVAKWWWYEPVLRTCDDGYYFSESQSTCVLAAESGCT